MLASGENILFNEASQLPFMKRFLLITAIVLATFGCERHSETELTQEQRGRGQPESTSASKWELKWDIPGIATLALVVATVALVIFTRKMASIAKSTEGVFGEIRDTLDYTRTRSEEAIAVRTMMTCMEQYQDLENKVRGDQMSSNPHRYFELLWNLHFAEYHFFKRRFLPDDVYGLWGLGAIQGI